MTEIDNSTEARVASGVANDPDSDLDFEALRLLEAVLFASTELLSETALAQRLPDGSDVPRLLAALRASYAERGVNLVKSGQGWAFRTAPDLATRLRVETEVSRRLSRAAIETLAVIAYHQPITRAEIEEIRGVSLSRGTLDLLLDLGWVRPTGRRRKTPGKPMQWGTSDGFLRHFDLETLRELPGVEELKALGLLDKRPALAAYASRGQLSASADMDDRGDGRDDGADDAEDDGDLLAALDPEEDEPLDPDDDPAHDRGGRL